MKHWGILLLAMAATGAQAQNSNTQCRQIGNTWNCDTTQRRDVWGDFNRQIEAQAAQQDALREQLARQGAQRAAARQAGDAREVWIRCRKRWNEAIEARDFELANALAQGCPANP